MGYYVTLAGTSKSVDGNRNFTSVFTSTVCDKLFGLFAYALCFHLCVKICISCSIIRTFNDEHFKMYVISLPLIKGTQSNKAVQTTLLVSRQRTDGNGCWREVIIHYSLHPVKYLLMEKPL